MADEKHFIHKIKQLIPFHGYGSGGWKEVVRIVNIQKVVITVGINSYDKRIAVRKCSQPMRI